MKRAKTDTIISALKILAEDIHSEDGVANAAIMEAAQRMTELQLQVSVLRRLLREASGPMSYGKWSTDFRHGVDIAMKGTA